MGRSGSYRLLRELTFRWTTVTRALLFGGRSNWHFFAVPYNNYMLDGRMMCGNFENLAQALEPFQLHCCYDDRQKRIFSNRPLLLFPPKNNGTGRHMPELHGTFFHSIGDTLVNGRPILAVIVIDEHNVRIICKVFKVVEIDIWIMSMVSPIDRNHVAVHVGMRRRKLGQFHRRVSLSQIQIRLGFFQGVVCQLRQFSLPEIVETVNRGIGIGRSISDRGMAAGEAHFANGLDAQRPRVCHVLARLFQIAAVVNVSPYFAFVPSGIR
mmetsp:Transcript_29143/g.53248  ORF Transcript_29143/g.53248 Transcript_29143/m.53248 type:complete len:267 (-) Transcript_29143:338-1138(-)